MTKENMGDLMYTKFINSDKNKQKKLLQYLLETIGNQDAIVDFLNGKKITNEDKNFKEGDMIYIKQDVSCYPKLNKKYYESNSLIVNDLYIRVLVSYINPVTGYVGIEIYTEKNKLEVVDIYTGYIPEQNPELIM
jgi:hypothetical protein